MNNQEFSDLMETRFERTRAVLAKKASEYARGDRLSNFKRAAAAMGCTPERACLGMLMKHLISIIDMVNDVDQGGGHILPMWDEKLGDAINYLILLEGLVTENA